MCRATVLSGILLSCLLVSLLAAATSAEDERPPARGPDLLGAFERMTVARNERNQWREVKDELAAMHSDALIDYLAAYTRLSSLRLKVLRALSED